MSRKKTVFMVLILVLLLATVAAGLVWHMQHYVMVDFRFYPKDAQMLDLRDEELTIRQYKRLSRMLPDCEIRWNVPFQGRYYPDDTQELTVTTLTDADVDAAAYLKALQKVNAEGCADYPLLLALQKRNPQLQLAYNVAFSDGSYPQDAEQITLRRVSQEDVPLLKYLPKLQRVVVAGGSSTENMDSLRGNAHNLGLEFCIEINGQQIPDTVQEVTVTGIADDELNLLQFLPNLRTLHMENPEASGENVVNLRTVYPRATITWEKELFGKTFSSEEVLEEIDLSDVQVGSLEKLEAGMAYFPNAKGVFLGQCGIDNEQIAAFRRQVRDRYKVVWTVTFGGKLPTRTDTKDFFPSRDGVNRFTNDDAYNLRYCEEIVCMDIGHMTLSDVSFLANMPELEYLILAHTQVQYINGIENCKKLKFLELDWSLIKDLTPLQGCTALEDLNIGKTWPDITPVLEMTWLKNLYMIDGRPADAYKASQALPDTHVVASGGATVGSGWRKLPNYYAMRDYLGVPYMHG